MKKLMFLLCTVFTVQPLYSMEFLKSWVACSPVSAKDKELYKAVAHGWCKYAETAINSGANVNSVSYFHLEDNMPFYRKNDSSSLIQDWDTPLMVAVKTGNLEMCKLLIKNGANVNAEVDSETPLMKAIQKNQYEICALFLTNGAQVDTKNWSSGSNALCCALLNGCPKMVQLLVDYKADVDGKIGSSPSMRPLSIAIKWKKPEIAKILVEAGAKLNARGSDGESPLYKAAHKNYSELCKLIIEKGGRVEDCCKGMTPLMGAASSGSLDACRVLVQANASVDTKNKLGETALMIAARFGHANVCSYLTNEAGADVNPKDKSGKTALVLAAQNGQLEACKVLAEKVKNIDEKDYYYGLTALMYAAKGGSEEIVRYLVERGADRNAKDKDGNTALLFAVGLNKKRIEVCKILIKDNPDLDARNSSGFTALLKVLEDPNQELWNMLINAGASQEIGKCTIITKKGDPFDEKTPLIKAVGSGCKGICEFLINKGADPNLRDYRDVTPLMHAVLKGHKDIIEFLIASGADVNPDTSSSNRCQPPLAFAIEKNNSGLASLLISHGATTTWWSLAKGIMFANKKICLPLLQKGQHVGVFHLTEALKKGRDGMLELLLTHACMIPDAQDVKKAAHRVKGVLLYMQRVANELGKNIPKEIRHKILISDEALKQDVTAICFDLMRKGWEIPSHLKNVIVQEIIIFTRKKLKKAMSEAFSEAKTYEEKDLLDWNSFELKFAEVLAENIHDCVWNDKYSREFVRKKEVKDTGSCIIL